MKEIPSAKPVLRKDLSDLIYKDQFSKWSAISQACNNIYSTGQPILIGTTTVEKSEINLTGSFKVCKDFTRENQREIM